MPTSPTPITPLPTAPSRADPANFPARADAFLGSLGAFGTQTNALATNVFNNATEAAASTTAAAASQTAAAGSASAAASSQTAAAGSASAAASSQTAAASSASAAATSAAAAATSATAAAGSESAASISATQAASSASAASTSRTAAATSEANAALSATGAANSATQAASSASAAASSATTAVNAPGSQGTSTTSHNISTGSKTFVTQSGKSWIVGQWVLIANSASAANWMSGYITAYSGSSLTVQVESTGGSGTGVTTWNISLAAPSTDADLNVLVIEHLQHLYDLAGIAARRAGDADIAGTSFEQITVQHLQHLLDLVGVVARAISGGDIFIRRGTVGDPSLHIADDPTTGMWSPGPNALAWSVGGIQGMRLTADRRLGLGDNNNTPTGFLDVADNKVRIRTAQTPATSGAAGNQGEIAWDANYVYVCTATNTWRRAAIATW